jgi:thiol-disulfide isomerase/thioredoxin
MRVFLRAVALWSICFVIPASQAKRLPNLEFKSLTGQTEKLADLKGSITVVNFWATWCGPCKEELPLLEKLHQEYAGRKVRFVAISADEEPENKKNRAKIDMFLNHQNLGLEVWLGADLDMLDKLQLANVLPETMILDEQGEIVARIMGQAREDDVKGPVEWLLNGKTGPAPAPVTKRY